MLTWAEDERPPTMCQSSWRSRPRDILRPAVDDLARRAREEHVDLCVHDVAAMFHVWMTRAIPEGRRTRRELTELVVRRAT